MTEGWHWIEVVVKVRIFQIIFIGFQICTISWGKNWYKYIYIFEDLYIFLLEIKIVKTL
jgi:hypothetical protein